MPTFNCRDHFPFVSDAKYKLREVNTFRKDTQLS